MSDYSSMATLQNNSQTAGFATAVQRARLVAAKLGGGKRSLEDGPEPIAKKVAPVEPAYQQPQQQQQPQHQVMSGPASSSSIPPMGGPGPRPPPTPAPPSAPPNLMPDQSINDYIRVPDKMVGLIIGRGGEQITRLQAESGCKIQMAPDSGGQPDRLCTLTGSREAIQRAKELVNQIVNHRGRENAPQHQDGPGGGVPMPPMPRGGGPTTDEIMLPGPKVGLIIGKNGKTIKQLQEQSGAKMIVIQEGPNTEYEKPLRISGDAAKVEHAKQLVYELLADKDMQSRYDDGGFNSDQGNGLATNSTEVLVPKVAVGVVIGRGGDMIKKIQADTGARVQFHQERDEGPGDKRCYLQGKPHQVEQARQMIEDLISSVNRREQDLRSNRGRGGSGQRNGDRPPEFAQQWQETPEMRVTFTVSNVKCGLIIGRGGEVIKQINAQSGAHCELDRRAQGMDRNNRTFYIKGHPEAVEQCKSIIMEKVGMPVNFMQDNGDGNNGNGGGNGGNGGGGGGGGPGGSDYYGVGTPAAWGYNPHWHQPSVPQQQQPQVSINPTTGQPDYSQQWIDYYRSLGLMREAEAIEQQAKQSSASIMPSEEDSPTHGGQQNPAPAPAQPSGAPSGPGAQASSQPDYSAQWAEYYRSMGKIKEAEAIEAQIKLKQGQQMSEQQVQMQQPAPTPSPAPSSSSSNTMMAQYGAPQYSMYAAGVYSGYPAYQYPGGGVPSATTPDPNQQ